MEAILTARKKRRLVPTGPAQPFQPDMLIQLHELLQGERKELRFYSKVLGEEIRFVNPALDDSEASPEAQPVYTTRELSFVLSMSPEELQRYHYLKMKLV